MSMCLRLFVCVCDIYALFSFLVIDVRACVRCAAVLRVAVRCFLFLSCPVMSWPGRVCPVLLLVRWLARSLTRPGGRYLTGILAGFMTKTRHLCYVAAFPIPEVYRGINAFTLGAREVCSDIVVHVYWTKTVRAALSFPPFLSVAGISSSLLPPLTRCPDVRSCLTTPALRCVAHVRVHARMHAHARRSGTTPCWSVWRRRLRWTRTTAT